MAANKHIIHNEACVSIDEHGRPIGESVQRGSLVIELSNEPNDQFVARVAGMDALVRGNSPGEALNALLTFIEQMGVSLNHNQSVVEFMRSMRAISEV